MSTGFAVYFVHSTNLNKLHLTQVVYAWYNTVNGKSAVPAVVMHAAWDKTAVK